MAWSKASEARGSSSTSTKYLYIDDWNSYASSSFLYHLTFICAHTGLVAKLYAFSYSLATSIHLVEAHSKRFPAFNADPNFVTMDCSFLPPAVEDVLKVASTLHAHNASKTSPPTTKAAPIYPKVSNKPHSSS